MASIVMDQLPIDNEGWFKKHVMDALADLKANQGSMMREQVLMHQAKVDLIDNLAGSIREHEAEDTARFAALSSSVAEMAPVKKIVYGLVGVILATVMAALLRLIILKS